MKDLDIGTTPIFMAGILKRYNGSSWVKAHLKADTAGGFSDSPMRLWDGANWVEVDRGG